MVLRGAVDAVDAVDVGAVVAVVGFGFDAHGGAGAAGFGFEAHVSAVARAVGRGDGGGGRIAESYSGTRARRVSLLLGPADPVRSQTPRPSPRLQRQWQWQLTTRVRGIDAAGMAPIRRWSDNDQYGHVNNSIYYHYFDTGAYAQHANRRRLCSQTRSKLCCCVWDPDGRVSCARRAQS